MFVTWNPEDGSEPITFNFDPDDMTSTEARTIEKEYGQGRSIEMWVNGLRAKEATARWLLLWWHLRQQHPRLPLKDVPEFRMRQMKVEMSVKELRDLQDRMARTKMDDDRRDQLNSAFEVDIADAMAREGLLEGEIVGPGNSLRPTD